MIEGSRIKSKNNCARKLIEGGEKTMNYLPSDMDYLEKSIKRLIEELKQKNCLGKDFDFLTKAERMQRLDDFVDDFISQHDI